MGYGFEDVKELIYGYLKILKEHFHGNLISMAVFGSIARGEAKSESDIDLLIVIKDLPVDIGARVRELTELKFKLKKSEIYRKARSRGVPTLISEIILTPEEVSKRPPILLDITVDGIIVYDKDDFLFRELEKMRKKLKELGAKRVKSKHGWYWILKPDAKFGEAIRI
ncbi:MAG: nucleotidyltransferase domain-containing protein [Thermoprotei archaeon]|nr:nucleotidyltransferase domain-containing protein [Thermoprotei archaeon]